MMRTQAIRGFMWRLGRKIYCFARSESSNSPDTNGEYWLLGEVLKEKNRPALLLDIGANRGNWTAKAIELRFDTSNSIRIHAFEPCTGTRAELKARFSSVDNVFIHHQAISAVPGTSTFFFSEAGAGTNSLSNVSGAGTEIVDVQTIDLFVEKAELPFVSMIKIDVEGFDMQALKGLERCLANGLIELIQFEYNWRWLLNNNSLRNVFELIDGKPYHFAKLIDGGLQIFDTWHFELDKFFESNYVIIRKDSPIVKLAQHYYFTAANVPRSR